MAKKIDCWNDETTGERICVEVLSIYTWDKKWDDDFWRGFIYNSSFAGLQHWGMHAPKCPPSEEQLRNDPTVQKAALQAMRASKSGTPRARERGGWIYARNGKIIVRHGGAWRGTPGSFDVSNPPIVPGAMLVGIFHTHPKIYLPGAIYKEFEYHAGEPEPSTSGLTPDTDIKYLGIPGIVVAEVNGALTLTPYGPERRGSDPGSASPPNAGFPGNSADTRGLLSLNTCLPVSGWQYNKKLSALITSGERTREPKLEVTR
jgi:hypothetical protein